MSSKNNNSILMKNDYVEKAYGSKDRYESEAYWLKRFKEKGFKVPVVLRSNSETMIHHIERLKGSSPEQPSVEQLQVCVDILRTIWLQNDELSDIELQTLAETYVTQLDANITRYCETNGKSLSRDKLHAWMSKLKKNFKLTLFKDAQPSNWIFSDNDAYMIDFDYVRRSFFFSDLTQLMNYCPYLTTLEKNALLDRFLGGSLRPDFPSENLFKLAQINSCLMAIKYGRDKHGQVLSTLLQTLNDNLKDLGIINE